METQTGKSARRGDGRKFTRKSAAKGEVEAEWDAARRYSLA